MKLNKILVLLMKGNQEILHVAFSRNYETKEKKKKISKVDGLTNSRSFSLSR